MCFTIDWEETEKLQARKKPIQIFKYVNTGDKGALVSGYAYDFVYPKKIGSEVTFSPKGKVPVGYSSKKAKQADEGIYGYYTGDIWPLAGKPLLILSVKPSDVMAASGPAETMRVLVARAATVTAVVKQNDKRLAAIKEQAEKVAKKEYSTLPSKAQINKELAASLTPIKAAERKAQAKLGAELKKLEARENAIRKQMNATASKFSAKVRAANRVADNKYDALWQATRKVGETRKKYISDALRGLSKEGS